MVEMKIQNLDSRQSIRIKACTGIEKTAANAI